MAPMPMQVTAVLGELPGRRGRASQTELLEATASLLSGSSNQQQRWLMFLFMISMG